MELAFFIGRQKITTANTLHDKRSGIILWKIANVKKNEEVRAYN